MPYIIELDKRGEPFVLEALPLEVIELSTDEVQLLYLQKSIASTRNTTRKIQDHKRYKRGSLEGSARTTRKTTRFHSKKKIHGGKKGKTKYDTQIRISLTQGKEAHALDDSGAKSSFCIGRPRKREI